jgi:molybdate transport system regulatory protein
MSETSRLDIRLRIDFGSAASLGPGKIALLEHIDRLGSLSQAARELGLSYRRAWQLLDDLNHSFSAPVASTSIGGVGGGGVELTDFARELIAAYRLVESATLAATRAHFGALVPADPEHAPKSRLRRLVTPRAKPRKSGGPRSRAH